MKMFQSFLDSIPKNRSLMVNELDLPDDVTLSPYVWDPDDSLLTVRSDSLLSSTIGDYDVGTPTTDSSIPLSRAMTDSEIDYARYRRYKNRSFSCPWEHMRAALDAFPPGYLTSLNSFQSLSSDLTEELDALDRMRVRRYNDELRLKMARFFADECRVFSPDDPGLKTLEEALRNVDMKTSAGYWAPTTPIINLSSLDDPRLKTLEQAFRKVDMKALESELDSITYLKP